MLSLSDLQKQALGASEVAEQALEAFWKLFPELTFDAAVGSLVMLLKGEGQFRNERFSPLDQEPSDDFKSASSKVE